MLLDRLQDKHELCTEIEGAYTEIMNNKRIIQAMLEKIERPCHKAQNLRKDVYDHFGKAIQSSLIHKN